MQFLIELQPTYTVFCRINVTGGEAENEPLTLSHYNEIHCVNSCIPQDLIQTGLVVSKIWPGKVKSWRGAFIQAGTFIQQNTV